MGHHNPPPSGPSVLTGTSPRVYPLWGIVRRQPVLLPNRCGTSQSTKGGLFSSPTDVGYHNPPPSGPSVLHCLLSTPFGEQREGNQHNPPPSRPNVLTDTSPRVYPLWGRVRRLAHRPVSGSNTICNCPNPLLANVALFGFSASGFKSRLLGEGFHTLIKG